MQNLFSVQVLNVLRRLVTTFAALWGLFAAPQAMAAALGFGPSDVTTTVSDSHDRILGWTFSTKSSVFVTALGVFDYAADGLNQSHDVGLYTDSGELLVSGTVPAGTGGWLDGLFRYTDVAHTLLPANSSFVVAALWRGNTDRFSYEIKNFVVDPAIAFNNQPRYEAGFGITALAFPTNTAFSTALIGPNFQLAPVPEPEAYVMLLAGLGVIGAIARRRKQ